MARTRAIGLCLATCLAGAAAVAGLPASDAQAGDWPGWRGPTGCGNTDEKNLPLSWGGKDNTNVIWKVELPKSAGISPSSPIVVGDSVIVTTAIEKPALTHHVACFSTKDGSLRWLTPVQPGPLKQMDGRAGAAVSTPCSDGQYVFAMFGSAVIAALDLKDGREKWRQELKDTAFDCGIGGSAVVLGQTVLFVADQTKGRSAVYAWDKKTGELKFQEKRPKDDFAHSTPIFVKVEGKDQMIFSANKSLQGLDPLTGKTLWWVMWGNPQRWVGDVSSPVFGGGLIYSDSGRGDQIGASLKPGGAGDVSKVNLKATFACKTDLGSPIIVGDFVYRTIGDRVQCMRLQTGEIVYTQPLKGIHAWASPVATAGRVYYATAGKSCVLRAGPTFETLGQGDLGDSNPASPAVSDGRLFLKGTKFLWCVGEKAPGDPGQAKPESRSASPPPAIR